MKHGRPSLTRLGGGREVVITSSQNTGLQL